MDKKPILIIAAGESSPDLRYATGFAAPDAYLYFEYGDEKLMVVSTLERDRAAASARQGVSVDSVEEVTGNATATWCDVALALAAKGRLDAFRVPADFPLLYADKLRAAKLEIEPESGILFPEREFKNDFEITEITRALRLAEAGVRNACAMLAEAEIGPDNVLFHQGEVLTSERLRRVIDLTLVGGNAQPTGTIAAGGVQSSEPHHHGSGPLYAHTPIVMDVFPRLLDSGYWGDLTRTVVKGKAPEIVVNAYCAVREARDVTKAMLRPGAIPAELHQEAMRILEKHGFRTGRGGNRDFGFFHSLGHGVGLEIHELPRLSIRNDKPLRGGEVLTVEPGLYYPEWGGIRLEDLMVLTADGAVCLTRIEDFLTID